MFADVIAGTPLCTGTVKRLYAPDQTPFCVFRDQSILQTSGQGPGEHSCQLMDFVALNHASYISLQNAQSTLNGYEL